MSVFRPVSTLVVMLSGLAAPGPVRAQAGPRRADAPIVLRSEGSFFVGGHDETFPSPGSGASTAMSGDITVGQMYVQYQIPMKGDEHVPVVMVHGCCLSSKMWETTPDGRMGWREYFVRKDRPVYLAEQVSRARSGFDPTAFAAVRAGRRPPDEMPDILEVTHQLAWRGFRFGPSVGKAFSDEQFPVDSVGEFYKQIIPDLNSTLTQNPNPTWSDMAALASRIHGAVLMGHSQSGFFPERAALIDPSGFRGIVSIEPDCATDLTTSQIATLARIPTLILFGDHLDDVPGGPVDWPRSFASCKAYVHRINGAGGDADLLHLPDIGIHGNSHVPMQDRNNLQVADRVISWIDQHVESR